MSSPARLSTVVTELLPYLRRFARALTGLQTVGDQYAADTLERLLINRKLFDQASTPRIALFAAFFRIWQQSGKNQTLQHNGLTPFAREALLLKSIEGFSVSNIAEIMTLPEKSVTDLLVIARNEMRKTCRGSVMVIEDEALIADDLQNKITDLGHSLFGIARTRNEAIEMAKHGKPNLILSDIQLADGSSGIDAVADIFGQCGEMPVIFVTAFPERLLTGEGDEPAFIVTKPYDDEQMRSAIGQAMLFASLDRVAA